MHLSIVAYGTWGDVRPGIALGLALKDAGYGVRLVVTEDFAGWVEGTGLEVHLLPVDKHAVMKRVSSETNPLRVVLAVHQEIAPALHLAGRELLTIAEDTDALLVNEWLLGVASGIAERRRLKLIHLAMQPRVKTRHIPISTMPALPGWLPLREIYNLLTYDVAGLLRWWSYVRAGNALRITQLELPPLSPGGYSALLARTPSITLVSQHIVPRPKDWEAHHRMTGFLFYEDDAWHPPDELEAFIQAGPAPIYLGFGSMHDNRPKETTRLILDALRKANRRAVLYRGWANLGHGDLPDGVYRLEYAPHHWLFPRMAAVVHHAGSGTSAAALRAGVPSIPVPHSGDQAFWARRMHRIGAATRPLPRGRLSADELATRITEAVEDPHLRRRSAELGDSIRGENAVERTVAAIDDELRGPQPARRA